MSDRSEHGVTAAARPQRLGLLGVGTVGEPVARRLADLGHRLAVCDHAPRRMESLADAGVTPCASPAELAAAADVVLVCLPDRSATEAAVLDPSSGLVAAMAPGSTLIDLSTNEYATTMAVGAACAERSIDVVDAPVSAAFGKAREGRLTIMVGGDAQVVDRVAPILDGLGSVVVHLGPYGSGTVAKLVTQITMLTNLVTALEGMLVARKAGVDVAAMLELLKRSNGTSHSLGALERFVVDRDFDRSTFAAGSLQMMLKDLDAAEALMDGFAVPHPVTHSAGDAYRAAKAEMPGSHHFTSVATILERAASTDLRGTPQMFTRTRRRDDEQDVLRPRARPAGPRRIQGSGHLRRGDDQDLRQGLAVRRA